MSARIRLLPFICILICFTLLGLTRRAFAVPPCTVDGSTWTFAFVNYYDCEEELLFDFNASSATQNWSSSGYAISDNSVINGCLGIPNGTRVWLRYTTAYVDYEIYVLPLDAPGCSDSTCSSERAAAESECGGPDLYVIDEQTCEWHCDDSQDCLDSDDDGAADVCDPCPDNPDISEEAVETYRLNGDSMSEKCGEATMSCDGSINFEGNTGTICQPVDPPEVKVTECRAVRGSGAVCKADKDTDGDGTYDTDDEDDDGDGTDDPEDTDDDGDGTSDCEDPDHEDYRDYDNDGHADCVDEDDDNDGMPDGQDPCPQNSDPNCKDRDGDTIPDSEDPDDDGDGRPDSEDPCPLDPDPNCEGKDTDGDGDPDSTDDDDDGDGKPDSEDPCPTNPDPNCTDPCEGSDDPNCKDDDGDGIPDADELNPFPEPSPFTLEFDVSALFQKYLDRFSEFLASMRQTSVFSIPGQVLGGIPSSGGSPSITISTGESFGGDHEIDFSGWASGLAVIRGVLYAVFTALAVRIVILKR